MKSKLTLFLILFLTAATRAQVLPSDAMVDGNTIEDWSAEWWKWVFSIPTNRNPELDLTGSSANNGQPVGDVFFLAGLVGFSGTATRAFTVPEGKFLFLPLLNVWADNVYTIPAHTIDDLRQLNAAYIDSVTNLYASLDGIVLTNLYAHRAISPIFSFDFANADNIESYVAGQPVMGLDDPIVSDGFWIMLEPLSAGTHVLNFGGTFGSPFNFAINITDTITVLVPSLPEQVEELIASLNAATLSRRPQNDLLNQLKNAEKDFKRNQLRKGIEKLGDFQEKVRREVPAIDQTLAAQLIQAAQAIIAKAEAQF